MGSGAVVAAAAQRRKQLDRVLDAFRATAPDRAVSLSHLGRGYGEADELLRAGVLRAGPQRESWYLDESAYVAFRDVRPNVALRVVLAAALAVIAALLGWLTATRS
jgi:hypothetical protein